MSANKGQAKSVYKSLVHLSNMFDHSYMYWYFFKMAYLLVYCRLLLYFSGWLPKTITILIYTCGCSYAGALEELVSLPRMLANTSTSDQWRGGEQGCLNVLLPVNFSVSRLFVLFLFMKYYTINAA